MPKLTLVWIIAAGFCLGQLGWALILELAEWAGKLVGMMIKAAMERMLAARQSQVAAMLAAKARQRPPIVEETGGEV